MRCVRGLGQEEGEAGGARAALGPAMALSCFPAPDSLFLQCNVGWAGNGNVCGQDTDLDGYPDEPLPCIDNNKHCKQVGTSGTMGQGLCFTPRLLLSDTVPAGQLPPDTKLGAGGC